MFGQTIEFNPDIKIYNETAVNTSMSEFSPNFWDHDLIYVRSSEAPSSITRENHFDLFFAGINLQKKLINSTPLSPVLNTQYHEGPAYHDGSHSEIYFSSIDPKDSLLGSSVPPNKIMVSELRNGAWQKAKQSNLNETGISSLHPVISRDGVWMVFASNRNDGYGSMDLYMSVRKDSIWGEPANLGSMINTEAAEVFPYIDDNLNLYFARKNDATGLDIYLSAFLNGHYTDPVLLPHPINSDYDDFGICLKDSEYFGYFSSNRPTGLGKDDIYRIEYSKSLFKINELKNELILNVRHQQNNTPISNALINLYKLNDLELSGIDPSLYKLNPVEIYDSIRTDLNGNAIIENPIQSFLIKVSHPGMEPWNKIYIQNASRRSIDIFLSNTNTPPSNPESAQSLSLDEEFLEIGTVLTFDNIYYAFNSYSIEEGAAFELDALVTYLKNNPSVKIELIAHTDARGEKAYNQSLSEKRAAAAKSYLELKGIDGKRIKISGQGEEKIRNHCKDGVKCSDEEHNFNRRTEVIILSK